MASPGGADDHGQSGDDVVSRGHHREQEDGAQEAAEVVDRILEKSHFCVLAEANEAVSDVNTPLEGCTYPG